MTNSLQSIAIDKLLPHPDNPNRMSKVNFGKLVRNIERTGRYEPLVVRPCPGPSKAGGYFEIINGHHRWQALRKLGYRMADAVVWDIDDQQTQILLATLNRLGGTDVLDKKLALLKKLSERIRPSELAKLLPQTARQLERLTNLRLPGAPAEVDPKAFAMPLVFFVSGTQQQMVEKALALAEPNRNDLSKAAKKAAALATIADHFVGSAAHK